MCVPSLVMALALALLTPGRPVDRAIAGGAVQTFGVDARAQDFVHAIVDQGTVDLAIEVWDPAGKRLARFDYRERGEETVAFVAEMPGVHRLRIQTMIATAPRASYRVRLDRPRPTQPEDRALIEAHALSTEAKRLLAKGDRQAALDAVARLAEARPRWRDAGGPSGELAAVIASGDAHYALAEYETADRAYREALTLNHNPTDRRIEGEILNNIGMVAVARPDLPTALDFLQRALDEWRAIGFTFGEATALNNRGILLRQSGEYDQARQHYARALALYRSLKDPAAEAYTLNNIAIVQESLGNPREALEYLTRAILLFERTDNRRAAGRALIARARIHLALGRPATSMTHVRRGLALVRAAGDRLAEADGQEHLGRILDVTGQRAPARAEFERARASYRAVGSRRGEADSLHDIGVSHLRAGEYAAAIASLEPARALRRQIGMPGLEADTLYRLAQAEHRRGHLDEARGHLETALDRAEQLRAGVLEKELRATHLGSTQRYYREYVDVLMQLHRARPAAGFDARAFEAAERLRARGLVERLRESWTGGADFGDEALLARVRALRRDISYLSWQIWQRANRRDSGQEDTLTPRLDALLREHRDAEAEIRRADPRYAALQAPQPMTIDVLRRDLLDEGTMLLAYALGDDRSHLWIVTSSSSRVIELPPRARIEPHARRLARLLGQERNGPAPDEVIEGQRREAAALSKLLLSRIEAPLPDRLVIVPDGALNDVPFAVLPAPTRKGALFLHHDMITLPSATMWGVLRKEFGNRTPAPKVLAVFADPVFDAEDHRVKKPAGVSRPSAPAGRRVTRLPFSREEADRILRGVPAALKMRAIDFDASRERVTAADMRDYRFVHFATHAFRDDRRPSLSGIVLSLVGPTGEPRDGFLRLQDIFTLRLRADLVVLSACETGAGAQATGEGVSGLTEGFFYAGAARVLSTLWPVDDEATAEVMARFYAALRGPKPAASPAAALRQAQIAVQKQHRWRDPYYWSGFVLYGDW